MNLKRSIAISLLAIMVGIPAMAYADAKPNIVLKLKVEKEMVVTDEEGKTRLEWQQTEDTNPGDMLKYSIQYTNEGDVEAKGVVINDPIPRGTVYVANSATGQDADITFSMDGKAFQAPPMLTYKVRNQDGTEEEYVVTPDMYTHIRWILTKPVAPGSTGTLGFKVKVK